MFKPFLSNWPDGYILFSELLAIFFIDNLLRQLDDVTVVRASQSAVGGNRNHQYSLNWTLFCKYEKTHVDVASISTHHMRKHFTKLPCVRAHLDDGILCPA